jgi:hypothetical protein
VAIRRWATRNLRPGDLTALAEIARARYVDTQAERIERLNRRGFVKKTANKPMVTLLGRTALWVRHFTKHWAA